MTNDLSVHFEVVPRERRPSSSPGVWLEFSAGSRRLQWVLYLRDAAATAAVEMRVRSVMESVRRMPAQHLAVLDTILVVEQFPGRRTTGGGYWKNNELSLWMSRENVTGVPALDIRWHTSHYRRANAGIIALTRTAMMSSVYQLSVLHEIAHSVDNHIGITLPGATVNDFRGVHYHAPRPGEYAADAYSRFIFNPNRVCDLRHLPEGENMRTCSQRLIALLRRSPAFASLPANWTPR